MIIALINWGVKGKGNKKEGDRAAMDSYDTHCSGICEKEVAGAKMNR
jgi:hypothetical protein